MTNPYNITPIYPSEHPVDAYGKAYPLENFIGPDGPFTAPVIPEGILHNPYDPLHTIIHGNRTEAPNRITGKKRSISEEKKSNTTPKIAKLENHTFSVRNLTHSEAVSKIKELIEEKTSIQLLTVIEQINEIYDYFLGRNKLDGDILKEFITSHRYIYFLCDETGRNKSIDRIRSAFALAWTYKNRFNHGVLTRGVFTSYLNAETAINDTESCKEVRNYWNRGLAVRNLFDGPLFSQFIEFENKHSQTQNIERKREIFNEAVKRRQFSTGLFYSAINSEREASEEDRDITKLRHVFETAMETGLSFDLALYAKYINCELQWKDGKISLIRKAFSLAERKQSTLVYRDSVIIKDKFWAEERFREEGCEQELKNAFNMLEKNNNISPNIIFKYALFMAERKRFAEVERAFSSGIKLEVEYTEDFFKAFILEANKLENGIIAIRAAMRTIIAKKINNDSLFFSHIKYELRHHSNTNSVSFLENGGINSLLDSFKCIHSSQKLSRKTCNDVRFLLEEYCLHSRIKDINIEQIREIYEIIKHHPFYSTEFCMTFIKAEREIREGTILSIRQMIDHAMAIGQCSKTVLLPYYFHLETEDNLEDSISHVRRFYEQAVEMGIFDTKIFQSYILAEMNLKGGSCQLVENKIEQKLLDNTCSSELLNFYFGNLKDRFKREKQVNIQVIRKFCDLAQKNLIWNRTLLTTYFFIERALKDPDFSKAKDVMQFAFESNLYNALQITTYLGFLSEHEPIPQKNMEEIRSVMNKVINKNLYNSKLLNVYLTIEQKFGVPDFKTIDHVVLLGENHGDKSIRKTAAFVKNKTSRNVRRKS